MSRQARICRRGPVRHHQQLRLKEPRTFQFQKEVSRIKAAMECQFVFKEFDLAQLADGFVFFLCPRRAVRLSLKKQTVSPHIGTIRLVPLTLPLQDVGFASTEKPYL